MLAVCPEAQVALSYGMPTYRVGKRRLHVGAWQHGLSIYGWKPAHAAELLQRHPGLKTAKGTVRLMPGDAAGLSDDDLTSLVRAALDE